MGASRIDPAKPAYNILNGPYDWNRYPLAPLGCKVVVYEDSDTRGSWASRGVNAFYLGPAKDNYRCNNYYIPETWAYRISGSTELYPQHCQLPSMTPHQHFCALTDELPEHTAQVSSNPKGRRLLKLLGTRINGLLHRAPISDEQRVNNVHQQDTWDAQQRVIDDSSVLTVPRLTNAPPVMLTQNPMVKHILKSTPRLHRQITRNNMPGILPATNVIKPLTPIDINAPHRSKWGAAPLCVQPHYGPRATPAIPTSAQQQIITQQAMSILTLWEQASFSTIHMPRVLMKQEKIPMNFEHYANPIVHPVTGRTITSYKKLMHNPATAEIWQTGFGNDVGGMAQGCNL